MKHEFCPICEQKLKQVHDQLIACKNGCYSEHILNEQFKTIKIFDERFTFNTNLPFYQNAAKNELVKEKIAYWKTDYRYLSEILTREPRPNQAIQFKEAYGYGMINAAAIAKLKV